MTKTEACWDRTEGCCMTDAFERGTAERGWIASVYRNRDEAGQLVPEWTWECWLDSIELEHEVIPHATDTTLPSHTTAMEALADHQRKNHLRAAP